MASKVTTKELNELRGIVKEHWDKFTNEDLDKIDGMRGELVGLVQKRYGYAKQHAEDEVNQLFTTMNDQKQKIINNLAAKTDEVKQKVDQNLGQYNQKIQATAKNLPGNMDQALMRYPWLSLVMVFGVGLILGFLLKPRWGGK
jgi:uncharacterized protein YjbJ (UPF0337 family)